MTPPLEPIDTPRPAETLRARWPQPPRPNRSDGAPRRVGVEIEFAGLSAGVAAQIVARLFGGTPEITSRHIAEVDTPGYGRFQIGLDTRHAKHTASDDKISAQARDWFGDAASLVVPVEITCPPVPIAEASALETLVDALRAAGAQGTHASIIHAFGMQLNIEAASLDVADILDILRAYVLLDDWLRTEIAIDPARQVLAFETAFPSEYLRLLLDPRYAPDPRRAIDDYLEANPTRNRGLDMLPVWAYLDSARVARQLPDEKVNARPAFHYRLPNSLIDEPGWTLRKDWDRWLKVERLAGDPHLLAEAAEERLMLLSGAFGGAFTRAAQRDAALALGRRL
ncbi:MAG: amidoligase family protein [Paracoccaceae bacterium]